METYFWKRRAYFRRWACVLIYSKICELLFWSFSFWLFSSFLGRSLEATMPSSAISSTVPNVNICKKKSHWNFVSIAANWTQWVKIVKKCLIFQNRINLPSLVKNGRTYIVKLLIWGKCDYLSDFQPLWLKSEPLRNSLAFDSFFFFTYQKRKKNQLFSNFWIFNT